MQSLVSTCRFLCRGSLETPVCGMQLLWIRSGSRLVCRQRLASLAAHHTTSCVTDQPCFQPRSLSAPNLSLHLTANLICTCLGWLITRGSLTISISFDQQMATIDSALAPERKQIRRESYVIVSRLISRCVATQRHNFISTIPKRVCSTTHGRRRRKLQ